ncbi:hypothetical protein DL93DRAFT_2095224 [Clavulina sp. PMI_390]|nr:hypothetical protein DL93DRAFT_2095224 [Clavulina sp. PMI_390]
MYLMPTLSLQHSPLKHKLIRAARVALVDQSIPIIPYCLLASALIVAFGAFKAVVSYYGMVAASAILDLVLGLLGTITFPQRSDDVLAGSNEKAASTPHARSLDIRDWRLSTR